MTTASNTLKEQLFELNRLHSEILKIMNAFHDAIITDNEFTNIELSGSDGTITNLQVPTNVYLSTELKRLSATVANLTDSSSNIAGVIVNDELGDFREIIVDSYRNAMDVIERSAVQINQSIELSTNNMLQNMTSTSMHVKLSLPTAYSHVRKFKVERYDLDDTSIDLVTDGMSRSIALQTFAENDVDYIKTEGFYDADPLVNRYYGTFDVLDVTKQDDGSYKVLIRDIRYSDMLNVADKSRELNKDDYMITADGRSRYQITNIRNNTITVEHISGFGVIETGEAKLVYNHISAQSKTLRIPVRPSERSIIFIAPIHQNTDYVSEFGGAIKLTSTEFSIETDDFVHDFDTYVSKNVINIGAYLESLAREGVMSRSMAVEIDKPELSNSSFKVVQINKHITNTANMTRLTKLVAEKNSVASAITVLNSTIAELTSRISIGNYNSTAERQLDESTLASKIQQRDSKSALFSSAVKDINTLLTSNEFSETSPKFRIRGFWDVNEPTIVNTGVVQRIVQYQYRYRYVSVDTDTSDATVIQLGDSTGVVSAWNYGYTNALDKIYNELTNTYVWSTNNIENGDISNINEIDVPISYGEGVQLQVRAIGEAGFPNNAVKSSWSDAINIEFPEQLSASTQISSIIAQNESDMVQITVDSKFKSEGLTDHVAESFVERDKTYSHTAHKIFSGFVTPEQISISLYEKIKDMVDEIDRLREIVDRRSINISVELLDESGASTPVNNMSTVKLFAGYYDDVVNVTDDSAYGTIVEKTFYIRLSNKYAQTAELLSLSPGSLIVETSNTDYSNVPFSEANDNSPLTQLNGQIIYTRNKDISGTIDLVTPITERSVYTITSSDINQLTPDDQRHVVHWTGAAFETVDLNANAVSDTYFAVHENHPLYKEYAANINASTKDALTEYMNGAATLTPITRADNVQLDSASIDHVGFRQNDKYLIGKPTCGAKLFMQVNNHASLQVPSSDTAAAMSINQGSENAVLIPLIFQYRMTDAIGRLNGDPSLSVSASNIEYKKRVGFDMLIANSKFSFDVVVSAKLRPNTISALDVNVSTIAQSTTSPSTTAKIL